MKKNTSKMLMIIYAVCALVSFMTETYFIINYSSQYVVIGAVGVVLVVASAFLVDEIYNSINREGKSQPEESGMEEMIKIQKAMYINSKNIMQDIHQNLHDNTEALVQAFEENKNSIIENEKNIAKVLIKKNMESNDELISALGKLDFSQIQMPEIQMPEINIPEIKIPEIKIPEIVLPEGFGAASSATGNSDDIDKAKNEIVDIISNLSAELKTVAKIDDLVQLRDKLSQEIAAIIADSEDRQPLAAVAMEEPVIEEPIIEEPVEETIIEEPVIEEPIIEEPIIEEPIIEEPVIEEPVIEEPIIEKPVIEEQVVTEPVMDDPNKQLSADEIAAMFANVASDTEEQVPEELDLDNILSSMTEPDNAIEEVESSMPQIEGDLNKQLSADEIAALFASVQ